MRIVRHTRPYDTKRAVIAKTSSTGKMKFARSKISPTVDMPVIVVNAV